MIEALTLSTVLTVSTMISSGAQQINVEEYIGRKLTTIEKTVLFDPEARIVLEEAAKFKIKEVRSRSWCILK
jgi:hypothetical protein